MATDVLFPLYEVLVENIFGGVGIAIISMAIILSIMLLVLRTGKMFILSFLIFYALTMTIFYYGSIGLVIGFIITGGSLIYQLVKMIYHNYA